MRPICIHQSRVRRHQAAFVLLASQGGHDFPRTAATSQWMQPPMPPFHCRLFRTTRLDPLPSSRPLSSSNPEPRRDGHASCNEKRSSPLERAPMDGQKAPGRGRRGSSTAAAAPCAVPLHRRVWCNSGHAPSWLTSPRADPRALLDVPGIAAVACVRQGCARLSHWRQGPVLQLDTPRDPPSSETSHIAGGPFLNGLPSVPIVLRDARARNWGRSRELGLGVPRQIAIDPLSFCPLRKLLRGSAPRRQTCHGASNCPYRQEHWFLAAASALGAVVEA